MPNGRIAAVATSKNGSSYGRKPKLYVFEQNGDTVFTKLFEDENHWYSPTCIKATADSGFAIAGYGDFVEWNEETNSWVTDQRIFLIKTDSLGNDVETTVKPIAAQPIGKFELVCYPNPASGEFWVDLPEENNGDVLEIYATNGSLVYEQPATPGVNRIDLCGVRPGMYLARLREAGMFGKIIIE